MHTVELLEAALDTARRLGIKIREENLEGRSGICELRGQKWLFLDLACTASEQLEQVGDALRAEPGIQNLDLPLTLRDYLGVRRIA